MRFSASHPDRLLVSAWDTVRLVLVQRFLKGGKGTHVYMLPLTHGDTRPCGSTMSPRTSKKRNSTIEQQYLRVLSERAQGRLVEGSIMEYASASLYLGFFVFPLTCTYDGARLDLETERMMYLGSHSNAVSAMSFAREQRMPISLPWLIHTGLTYGSLTIRRAHHRLMGSLAQILGSPRCRRYIERQRRHRHINTRSS